MRTIKFFSYLLLTGALVIGSPFVGCSGGGDDEDNGDGGGGGGGNDATTTAFFAVTAASGGNGEASARVEVPAGTNKLSITSRSGSFIATDSVVGDDGVVHVNFQGEFTTLSTDFSPFTSSVNVPSRDVDAAINGGGFTVGVTVASSVTDSSNFTPASGEEVTFTVLGKSDPDLGSGTLPVNVFYVGGAQADVVVSAIGSAISEMRSIYAQTGVTVDIAEFSIDGPSVLPLPTDGDSLYLSASSGARSPAVNIFIGLDVGGPGLLGISGGIPGAPIPTPNSGVAVSAVAHAGPDGEFSSSELLVLGETLAHEAGHFIGLFHPVEGDFASLDPLGDTPACSGQNDCLSNSTLIHNLMFPFPVDDGSGGLVRQNQLSGQQGGVMNRYSAVN